MFEIREETDVGPRESMLDICFGASRFEKTCERLREGRRPADGLSLVVEHDGAVVATVRLWHVTAGTGRPALMLGPLAVDPSHRRLGLGAKIMREALSRARALGHGRCSSSATLPITGASASPSRRRDVCGCGARTSDTACWPWNSSRGFDGARPDLPTGAIEERPDLAALAAAAAQGAFGMGRAA